MYGCVPNNKENEKVNLWSNKESAKEWVSRDFGKLGEVPNSVIPVQQQGSQQLSNQQQRQDRDNNAKENNKDGNGMENDMQVKSLINQEHNIDDGQQQCLIVKKDNLQSIEDVQPDTKQ